MIICPKCQTKNQNGAKYCASCRSRLKPGQNDAPVKVINEQKCFENCTQADCELSLIKNEIKEQTDLKEIFIKASDHLREAGIGISESDLAMLFGALGSGRLIRFADENAQNVSANILCRLFSASDSPYCELENAQSLADMLLKFKSDPQLGLYYEDTLLLKEIYKASCLASPYIMNLGVHNEPCAGFRGFATRYSETPEALLRLPIQFSDDVKRLPAKLAENSTRFVSPRNLWFLMTGTMAGTLSENGVLVGIKAYFSSDNGALIKPLGVSCEDFARSIRICRAEYYLSEELWKRIDALEAALADRLSNFSFDNRMLRCMEGFSSVCLCLRGSEEEALDMSLACCVMPLLVSKAQELSLDSAGLYGFVKSFFEDMELVRCREYAEHS